MGFTSFDDLLNETTVNDKSFRQWFSRVIHSGATSAAGRWHDCFQGAGVGGQGVLTGTAGAGFVLDASSAGSLPLLDNNVSPDEARLLSLIGVTSATSVGAGTLMLVDLLYVYPSCVLTGTPTTLSNSVAKPDRFNSGIGVQCAAIVATAVGAAQPVLTMTYTNSGNTGSRSGTFAASSNSLPAGSLFTGGSTVTVAGLPNMRTAAGDSGVKQLDSYVITSGGTTGTVSFVLFRPIATVPLIAANTVQERDFLFQSPPAPKIDDNACLSFLVNINGSLAVNQIVSAELGIAWG